VKEPENTFESWDRIIKENFIESLKAGEAIKPNTPEWTFLWECLHNFKVYAERKAQKEKCPPPCSQEKKDSESTTPS